MKHKLYYQYAGSCFLLLFALLTYIIKFNSTWITSFDQLVTNWVYQLYPKATAFFLWITKFGNTVTVILLFIVISFLLIYGKCYVEAIWLASGFISMSGILNPLLKIVISRERPTLEHLVTETSYSFPSGHALTSMVLYGTIFLLIPLFFHSKTGQIIMKILLISLILLIGISRIYLGVHFPSDILAGYCLGLTWLLFSYPYYEKKAWNGS